MLREKPMLSRRIHIALTVGVAVAGVPSAPVIAAECGPAFSVRFIEGAPRDRFVIENTAQDGGAIDSVALDLRGSAGRLIFDTQSGGQGVEVFQPWRAEGGSAKLAAEPAVGDGDESLILLFTRFEPGQRYGFSIDVDDRLAASDLGQIRVSGGEMEGAVVTVNADGVPRRAVFGADNRAVLVAGCN